MKIDKRKRLLLTVVGVSLFACISVGDTAVNAVVSKDNRQLSHPVYRQTLQEEKPLTAVKYDGDKQWVMPKRDGVISYQNFTGTKRGTLSSNSRYETKTYYDVEGTRYYSLYKDDEHHQSQWMGYVKASDLSVMPFVKDKRKVTAHGRYTRYSNLFWKERGMMEAGTYYETSGYYTVNGTKYYSLYRYNAKGERGWYGYVNENALRDIQMIKKSRKVTAVGNYKRYSNFFWKQRGIAEAGTYYETPGYYEIKGTKYYSLYRYNTKGERGWYGYVNENALRDIQMIKQKRKVTAIGNYKRYSNFFWKQRGIAEAGTYYETTGYYNIKGTKYYSLYRYNTKGERGWYGYVNEKALRNIQLVKQKRKVTAVGNYNRYSNFFWKKRGTATEGTCYETSGYYTIKGVKYYSLYRDNAKGERGWYGYVNEKALDTLEGIEMNKTLKVMNGNYTRWSNLYFNRKKGTLGKTKKVVARRRYVLGNGDEYYSIYNTKNQWLGYVNRKSCRPYYYIKMNVPNYKQYDLGIPTGCEGVSLLEALHFQQSALNESPRSFLSKIPKANTPYKGFVGSPFIESSNLYTAIFSRPLANWGKKYGNVQDLTGKSMWDLMMYLCKKRPVVAYVSIHLRPLQWANWAFGRVPNNNHAMTIAGFDEENEKVYVSDPIDGKYWTSYYHFKAIYEARKMAVGVMKK